MGIFLPARTSVCGTVILLGLVQVLARVVDLVKVESGTIEGTWGKQGSFIAFPMKNFSRYIV